MSRWLQFATSNAHKVVEVCQVLPCPVVPAPMELHEVQTTNLEQLVRDKVDQAFRALQAPVMVEDTSLRFVAWGQMPGPFIKYFLENLGLVGLVDALSPARNWKAEAISGIGYHDGTVCHYFEARVPGIIVMPMGTRGWGWDAIFRPNGSGRTFGEMRPEEKLQFSMRTQAARMLGRHLVQPAVTAAALPPAASL